jgi:hypothetical protein
VTQDAGRRAGESKAITVHIAGTVRDCAEGLGDRLVRLERALNEAVMGRLHFHFFENDSTDTTRAELLLFQSGRANVTLHLADGLVSRFPRREERLAYCRNQLLASINASEAEAETDTVTIYLPMDLDIDIDWHHQGAQLSEAMNLVQSGWLDGILPASRPLYYDIHALRAPRWNSGDSWVAVSRVDRFRAFVPTWVVHGALVHSKQIPIERLQARGQLIPVESAFGGFGVYRLDRVKGREYASTEEDLCEHVAFNRGLRLAIMTGLEIPAPAEHLGGGALSLPRHRKWLLSWTRAMRRLPPVD